MKRNVAWLALPLLLCALISGVKWRAEHPTPTPEDLALREVFSRSYRVTLTSLLPQMYHVSKTLSRQEFKRYTDNLFVLPLGNKGSDNGLNSVATIEFIYLHSNPGDIGAAVLATDDAHQGSLLGMSTNKSVFYKLHPVTVERWTQFLKADLHPR